MARTLLFGMGPVLLATLLTGCDHDPKEGILQVTLADASSGTPLGGAIAAIKEGGLNGGTYVYGARTGEVGTGGADGSGGSGGSGGSSASGGGGSAGGGGITTVRADSAAGGGGGSAGGGGGSAGGGGSPGDSHAVAGAFTVLLPAGLKGVEVFADGYYPASLDIQLDPKDGEFQTLDLRAEAIPSYVPRPVASNLRIEPAAVAPGFPVMLTVDLAAGSPDDPLSAQVVVVQPDTVFSTALLSPPVDGTGGEGGSGGAASSGGANSGSPDGEWSQTLIAPSARGTYVYTVVAASQSHATSAPITASLLVQ